MKYKKSIIIIMLAIFLISIAAASASDVNETAMASDDTGEIDLSANSIETDDLKTNPEDTLLTQTDNEEIISEQDNGTFQALKNKISNAKSGETVTLENNYACEDTFIVEHEYNKAIIIDKPLTIDGQGHTIDAQLKCGIFSVETPNVTIKNINFINGRSEFGTAIASIGHMPNCNILNCSFINNTNNPNQVGGAIFFETSDNGSICNCTFINNSADIYGGAIVIASTFNTIISGCYFENNTAPLGNAICVWNMYEYENANIKINNNIFINHMDNEIYFQNPDTTSNIDYNWFGNNATNYNVQPTFTNITTTVWLFLNATVNHESISTKETAEAIFKLYSYNSTSKNITDYTSSANVNLTLDSNGKLDKDNIKLNEKVTYTPTNIGTGSITASIGNTTFTKTFTVTTDGTTFLDLNKIINDNANSTITLDKNYTYNSTIDSYFTEGILINRPVTINGNGHTIDANGKTRIFNITSDNVVLENIAFVNGNTAEDGGAVYFNLNGEVTNCNFIGNNAALSGGAVYLNLNGKVTNCNFTGNTATERGGAIRINGNVSTITNCNFIGNNATLSGGAVYLNLNGEVTNCNFTDNNATTGSAIYFFSNLGTKTISNSIFLNNKANAEALEVTKNENNITITFTGQNNLLNAIYSEEDVTFTNVTYWSTKGIANTDTFTPVRSNKEAGQNITVSIVVNGELVLNEVKVTDDNGIIVLPIIAGANYYISARHETDSYYTEAESSISNMTHVNVTSQTTTYKTVLITAKSNILKEVMPGELLFIVPNSNPINASYAGNGTWWAVHTFDDYASYEVSATYDGLDNVTISNATITINKANSTLTVGDIEFNYNSSGSTAVSFDGASGINASVVNHPEAVVNVKNDTITVSGLNVGTYTLTVTTIADANHNNVTKTATITVNRIKTELTASAVTATYNINKNLVITLKDNAGKALSGVKVSVDLNGAKTYTTDGNGQVKISTKGLAPKTYTAKITFKGNTIYAKSTKNVKATVKKAKPEITAKKKTFKASAKTKKYTITLKDNTGKAIKKAKVTLKVKGKTYKAKTNSKGKATFKITKLKNKGTYKATVTYKANKYYQKATKKVKITVKKT